MNPASPGALWQPLIGTAFPVAVLSIMLFSSVVVQSSETADKHALVFLSDFGLTERFVASMKGVAVSVDPTLQLYDLTHQIEPFNVWQASYMLAGTIDYWPQGTVFVSVVDPGVGTNRKSVVLQTGSGHFVVTPDNGSLTLVAERQGVVALREIDESVNRLRGSEDFHTFDGRDVYSYTGARLASGAITFDEVGPLLDPRVQKLPYQQPSRIGDDVLLGNVVHVEKPFGNIVTNIPKSLLAELGLATDGHEYVMVEISHSGQTVFSKKLPYVSTFGEVEHGMPLLYADSLKAVGLAMNNGDFSAQYEIAAGSDWRIRLTRLP
ncbi:MAG: S-adenosyl-l-methionine hydroxide adenosyltransferase family protein [Gammaproteobacteria bacterium]|nr:S-adenosyl-l-methionine hydroxide adenosyltransferase family protein [Gammaproteobacteria bacterium]